MAAPAEAPAPGALAEAALNLLTRADADTAGLWPRAAAALGRQAIELALDDLWAVRAPGLEETSLRCQLLCLSAFIRDQLLAAEVSHSWWVLTRACHFHPYEAAPTVLDLKGAITCAARITAEVEGIRNTKVSDSREGAHPH